MIGCCVVFCVLLLFFFFFKQKTAYEMRISDWSSDVCSSDLPVASGLVDGSISGNGYSCTWSATTSAEPPQTLVIDSATVNPPGGDAGCKIGRASCRERVCQYV